MFVVSKHVSNTNLHLFSELWLQWLQDEIRLVSEDKEREDIEALFDKAVKDYLCKLCCS